MTPTDPSRRGRARLPSQVGVDLMDPRPERPMLDRLRRRLSYANVVATLALFIALGGSSYAALTITGKNVRDGSLTGKDIKRNSLTGRQIREGRLDTVPRARNSARVGGLSAQRLLLKCPQGTLPAADVCVETQARPPAIYSSAASELRVDRLDPHSRAAAAHPPRAAQRVRLRPDQLDRRGRRAHRRGVPSSANPDETRRALHDRRAGPGRPGPGQPGRRRRRSAVSPTR